MAKAKTKVMVDIVAVCSTHGRFQTRRKPSKYQSEAGGKVTGFYCAIVCPVCKCWGKIITQTMVTDVQVTEPALQGILL